MTTLMLTQWGEVWDTDGRSLPRSPAALEREVERLRRKPRPSVDDLLTLGGLEDEIVGRYLALTDRSLTRRDREALRLGGPPSQDEMAGIVAELDECEFLVYLSGFRDGAVIGREGKREGCVVHRYLVTRFCLPPDAVAINLDTALVRGDWPEQERTVPLPRWAARISRVTTQREGIAQPVPGQRIRAAWLRRALSLPPRDRFLPSWTITAPSWEQFRHPPAAPSIPSAQTTLGGRHP